MKKIFFMLVGLFFVLACATQQKNTDNQLKQDRPYLKELSQLAINFNENFAETNAKLEKDSKFQNDYKSYKESIVRYSDREFTTQDFMFCAFAGAQGYTEDEIWEYLDPSVVVKNTLCENEFKFFQVFQTLPNMVLVKGCNKKEGMGDYCYSLNIRNFVTFKKPNEIYFDNKILKPNKNECPVYIGVVQYEAKNGITYTVPILSFESKKITKMRLEEILKIREETAKEIQ